MVNRGVHSTSLIDPSRASRLNSTFPTPRNPRPWNSLRPTAATSGCHFVTWKVPLPNPMGYWRGLRLVKCSNGSPCSSR